MIFPVFVARGLPKQKYYGARIFNLASNLLGTTYLTDILMLNLSKSWGLVLGSQNDGISRCCRNVNLPEVKYIFKEDLLILVQPKINLSPIIFCLGHMSLILGQFVSGSNSNIQKHIKIKALYKFLWYPSMWKVVQTNRVHLCLRWDILKCVDHDYVGYISYT